MKRIAFAAAAAALLGTGCISNTTTSYPPPPSGDIAVYWQFRDLDNFVAGDFGVTDSGCSTAGITDVDVEFWDGGTRVVYETVPCDQSGVPGAIWTLPVGVYTYRLTAYRLVDPVFEAQGSFSVAEGTLPREQYATLDVVSPAPLTLYYTLNGAFTCSGVSTIYYRIWNAAQTIKVADNEIYCDPQAFGFSIPNLALGNYFVEWFQAIDAGGLSRYERCNVTVRNGGFPVTVDLAPAPGGGCPL